MNIEELRQTRAAMGTSSPTRKDKGKKKGRGRVQILGRGTLESIFLECMDQNAKPDERSQSASSSFHKTTDGKGKNGWNCSNAERVASECRNPKRTGGQLKPFEGTNRPVASPMSARNTFRERGHPGGALGSLSETFLARAHSTQDLFLPDAAVALTQVPHVSSFPNGPLLFLSRQVISAEPTGQTACAAVADEIPRALLRVVGGQLSRR